MYNRGVNRGPIFFHPENWLFFLRRLRQYFVPAKVEMLAYTLMPNHYHLLVRIKSGDFGREIMHPFTISYTMAINKQMYRVGPLFQGPYQARCIKEDAVLQRSFPQNISWRSFLPGRHMPLMFVIERIARS